LQIEKKIKKIFIMEVQFRDLGFQCFYCCHRSAYSFGWWLVLICSEEKILLVGCWRMICSERKVLLAGV
jgi:hypothetical protein